MIVRTRGILFPHSLVAYVIEFLFSANQARENKTTTITEIEKNNENYSFAHSRSDGACFVTEIDENLFYAHMKRYILPYTHTHKNGNRANARIINEMSIFDGGAVAAVFLCMLPFPFYSSEFAHKNPSIVLQFVVAVILHTIDAFVCFASLNVEHVFV